MKKNFYQSIPGIKYIGYTECKSLQANIALRSNACYKIGIFNSNITEIGFFGNPVCNCNTEVDANGRVSLINLEFSSVDNLPLYKNLAFIVIDANDIAYLIGTAEPSYPIVAIQKFLGVPGGDTNVKKYKVYHRSTCGLVECVIGQ